MTLSVPKEARVVSLKTTPFPINDSKFVLSLQTSQGAYPISTWNSTTSLPEFSIESDQPSDYDELKEFGFEKFRIKTTTNSSGQLTGVQLGFMNSYGQSVLLVDSSTAVITFDSTTNSDVGDGHLFGLIPFEGDDFVSFRHPTDTSKVLSIDTTNKILTWGNTLTIANHVYPIVLCGFDQDSSSGFVSKNWWWITLLCVCFLLIVASLVFIGVRTYRKRNDVITINPTQSNPRRRSDSIDQHNRLKTIQSSVKSNDSDL